MNKKIAAAVLCASLSIASIYAQDQSTSVDKLTKTDRIWLAAYDDTTKVLATHFIMKRSQINKSHKPALIAFSISALALGTGAILLEHEDPPTTARGQTNYFNLLLLFGGTIGAVATLPSVVGGFVQRNPYTLKKYENLIELHKAGKPLPDFYLKKVFGHRKS